MYMERVKTPEELFFFFSFGRCGLSRLRRAKDHVSARLYSHSACARVRLRSAALMEGGGGLRQVSSLLTQAVKSAVGKVRPRAALYFSNNGPLVRLSHV